MYGFHALERVLLLVLEALVDLLENLMLDLACQSIFLGCLRNRTRGQVKINLVNHLTKMTFHVCHDDGLGKLLSVCLVTSIMFYLYMQIERALTTVDLLTVLIGADVLSVDLFGGAPVVLLAIIVLLLLSKRLLLFHGKT